MGQFSLQKVIGFLVILVVIAVIFGAFFKPEGGWLNKVAKTAETFGEWLFPAPDRLPPKVKPSDAANNQFESLITSFGFGATKSCWLTFFDFHEEYTLTMQQDGNDIYVVFFNEKGQQVKDATIKDKELCIVAENNAAQNFFDNFLDGTQGGKTDYTKVNAIVINEMNKIVADGKEYSIEDKAFRKGWLLNDDNWRISLLYNKDEKHVCFIPTFDGDLLGGCNAKDKGLDDNCIHEIYNGDYLIGKC